MYQKHQQILLLLLFVSSLSFGQSLEREVISSSGDFLSNNASLSTTIGEPITELWSNGSNQLTQGFQQGVTTEFPLPVELLDFQATRLDAARVQLTWQTTTEINNKGFYIERQLGQTGTFETIDFVEGQGNSTDTHSYEYIDDNAYFGTSYYQLRQTDFDGTFERSIIQAIDGKGITPKFSLYPNPTTSEATLQITSQTSIESAITLTLFDAVGKMRHQEVLQSNGTNQTISLPFIQKLSTGVYFLKIQIEDSIQSVRFVKTIP